MNGLATLAKLRDLEVTEARRGVSQLLAELAAAEGEIADLEQNIRDETPDPLAPPDILASFLAFSVAAGKRRDNLAARLGGIQERLEAEQARLSEAFRELKKVETLIENRQAEAALRAKRAEDARMDDIALRRFSRD